MRNRKDGGSIPGFDHLIPPEVSWENFSYAVERLREVCCFAAGQEAGA